MTNKSALLELASPSDFLAAAYEDRGTDYCRDKARAIRQGDQSGFIRTDVALTAIAAALRALAKEKGE